MNSIDPIRFTRNLFMLVNIILLAGSVFVYTLHVTAATKSAIRLFHFLKHVFTDQTKDTKHMFRLAALLLAEGIGWRYISVSPAHRDCFIHRNLYVAPQT